MRFDHEKLDVYQASIEFTIAIDGLADSLQGRNRHARDQLVRSSQSIPLNIAEGNGKRSRADRNRYFEIARGSATESAATLDLMHALGAIPEDDFLKAKALLHRIVSMLSKMTAYRDRARESSGAYGVDGIDYEHEIR